MYWNTDAGPLQVLFLAGALNRSIKQNIEDEPTSTAHGIYQLMMPPCSCCETSKEMIGVFWMRMTDLSDGEGIPPMNHIVPIIPGSSKCMHGLLCLNNS